MNTPESEQFMTIDQVLQRGMSKQYQNIHIMAGVFMYYDLKLLIHSHLSLPHLDLSFKVLNSYAT